MNGTDPNPPNRPAICPICGQVLKAGEELGASYVKMHGWWTLYHIKPEHMRDDEYPKLHVMNARCAQSGYKIELI